MKATALMNTSYWLIDKASCCRTWYASYRQEAKATSRHSIARDYTAVTLQPRNPSRSDCVNFKFTPMPRWRRLWGTLA